ncbi:hypothetical protein BSKO_10673 [Bryopsis sp. KO-2023]|nr:hypothetical protein BSKO_10673 [Bryopsis sp. KO-2023]
MGRDKVKARTSSELDARNSVIRLSGMTKPLVLHGAVPRIASATEPVVLGLLGHPTGPNTTGESPSLTQRMAEKPASDENQQQKDSTVVAVRFRPLNENEKFRGDGIVWSVDDSNTVGLVDRGTFMHTNPGFLSLIFTVLYHVQRKVLLAIELFHLSFTFGQIIILEMVDLGTP